MIEGPRWSTKNKWRAFVRDAISAALTVPNSSTEPRNSIPRSFPTSSLYQPDLRGYRENPPISITQPVQFTAQFSTYVCNSAQIGSTSDWRSSVSSNWANHVLRIENIEISWPRSESLILKYRLNSHLTNIPIVKRYTLFSNVNLISIWNRHFPQNISHIL